MYRLNRSALQVDTDFDSVVKGIAEFVVPLVVAFNRGESFSSLWRSGGPWIDEGWGGIIPGTVLFGHVSYRVSVINGI